MSGKQDDGEPVIRDGAQPVELAKGYVDDYCHGTDDAPAFVARAVGRLPAPYAIAVTEAICELLNEHQRARFTRLLLTVAQGRYRSVFED